MSPPALSKAIEVAHGQTALVRKINELSGGSYTQAHIWNWLNRDKSVPAEAAPFIELATGVSRAALCPAFPWGVVDSLGPVAGDCTVESVAVST